MREQGTIVSVIGNRGFGFIRHPATKRDLFFHAKDLDGLAFSDRLLELVVTFRIDENNGRPRALAVRKAM